MRITAEMIAVALADLHPTLNLDKFSESVDYKSYRVDNCFWEIVCRHILPQNSNRRTIKSHILNVAIQILSLTYPQ